MAGVPRLITFRVVLFFLLVLAVVAAGYGLIRWYAMDEWYVSVHDGHLAVYQGRPGGFLWFKPRLVDETHVTTKQVLHFQLPAVERDKREPSLAAARGYVENLHQEYEASRQLSTGSSTGGSSTTSGGSSGTSTGTSVTGGATSSTGTG